jgi:excisionase family DNA binding protein
MSTDPHPSPIRLLTAREVARILRVSRRSVYQLARRGEIPHVRIGRFVRFRADEIDAWTRSADRPPPAEAREAPQDERAGGRQ